jgi:hypothetical protein
VQHHALVLGLRHVFGALGWALLVHAAWRGDAPAAAPVPAGTPGGPTTAGTSATAGTAGR